MKMEMRRWFAFGMLLGRLLWYYLGPVEPAFGSDYSAVVIKQVLQYRSWAFFGESVDWVLV